MREDREEQIIPCELSDLEPKTCINQVDRTGLEIGRAWWASLAKFASLLS